MAYFRGVRGVAVIACVCGVEVPARGTKIHDLSGAGIRPRGADAAGVNVKTMNSGRSAADADNDFHPGGQGRKHRLAPFFASGRRKFHRGGLRCGCRSGACPGSAASADRGSHGKGCR